MAQYGWHNSPDSVHGQVNYFIKGCQRILKENLVGVYLHGDLASEHFNMTHSAIELLVVSADQISPTHQYFLATELLFVLSGHPSPFDVFYLRRPHLIDWRFPTYYEWHYSEAKRPQFEADLEKYAWRKWAFEKRESTAIASHLTLLQKYGMTLLGVDLQSVFPAVPYDDFRASLLHDYTRLRDKPLNHPLDTILTMCRVLHHFKTDEIATRVDGALWALRALPSDYHPIIEQALRAHREGTPQPDSEYSIHAFVGYVGAQMEALLHP